MRLKPPDVDELLNLTGLIYASALEPSKTTEGLRAMEACFDMAGSQIFTFHRETGAILESQMSAAVHRTLSDDYLAHWGNLDPRVPMLAGLPSGTATACHYWFDEQFVAKNAYYQEFLIPAGFRWAGGGVFDAGDGATTVIAGLRAPDQPAFDHSSVRLLGLLLPHMQRAGVLRQRLQMRTATTAAAPDLVERMPMSSFIVDDRGRLVLGNHAFHRSLHRLPLRLAGSWLRFEQSSLQQIWNAQLRKVFETRCATSFEASFAKHLSCRTHIVPWQAIAEGVDGTEQRLALVMMDESQGPDSSQSFEAFCACAHLTAAEREILKQILQGHSAKSIARLRDVSSHTVRNQVARILEKTNSRSQRELVARLNGLRSAP